MVNKVMLIGHTTCKPRKKLEERFWKMVDRARPGCWPWVGALSSKRYGNFRIGGRKGATHKARRVSWLLSNGSIPDGLWVCHRCDNPRCVRPDHLFLGTPKANSDDRDAKGRGRNGELHGGSRLTVRQVREIRRLYKAGRFLQREIGVQFGVRRSTVGLITSGKRWAHA